MISVMTWIHNRTDLFRWCLEAIVENINSAGYKGYLDLNVLDDGSDDGLDDLLRRVSYTFNSVNKWSWDSTLTLSGRQFNCPAEPYNILVKLCKGDIIWKTDPEMVILDPDFIKKALLSLTFNESKIIMPYPYHCYAFPVTHIKDIRHNYKTYNYPTHITPENARFENVYYQAVFSREKYLELGGVDERFSHGIGSEDRFFLKCWRRKYGEDTVVTMLNSACVHQFHGGFANGTDGVPQHLHQWVQVNENLESSLSSVGAWSNEGTEWGRIYDHIRLTSWKDGVCV